ncbi:MAG TPA: ABC transporter ATP-binding protein [Geminicoccus sp.]|uniref:ABC transporter ATP-binding protein n=1 Tax=Geminicoccus sp. TaxID=2024832 RepID=UPI002E2FE5C9|nr:ABC transporter ATP-binding protein [Geminicoccus sp.]HEX2527629.1 ABC transporter ATP-binding protein [Geminicoccus sp.]
MMQHHDPADAMVSFRNVRKSYDGRHLVVKDLNLDIRRGEFLTMLGPSGSGKTTTLMMLAGFEAASGGEIVLAGQRIDHVPPYRRDIGMVFQNYALFPHLTVAQNVAFPLKVRRQPKAEVEARVAAALSMVRLDGFADRRPSQLSGGQQQRVALARALVFEPKLVLMDEPLGALDKQLRENMQYEIKQLHERLGVTMVYVTHDQSEALTMSDRVAVFEDGVIQQLATPRDLYERPQNAFVARFIGENNRLPGRVQAVEGGTCRVEVNGACLRATTVGALRAGERVILSLRPERVALAPAPGSLPNMASGRVLELIYVGDHLRVHLRVFEEDGFIVKLANTAGLPDIRIDDEIAVGWSADDCLVLSQSASEH